MNAATHWFKFDPTFVGTPMQGEWCLWSFVTKHGRETYSGRWIVHDGSDLIVTDRGWSVPLVVGEAYFARVIPFREVVPRNLANQIEWEPLPGQTFNPEFSGYKAAHYATGNPELGWCLYSRGAGGCWNQRTKEIKAPTPGLQPERIDGRWYWIEAEIPEVKYLGSTRDGERFVVESDIERTAVSDDPAKPLLTVPARICVSPPTQTMIEDAGPPSTFVQDKLAEALVPAPSQPCGRCGEQISRQADGELWEHVSNKSIYCPNDDSGCSIATPMSEPGVPVEVTSVAELGHHSRRESEAAAYSALGMQRVANNPPPEDQKYAPGTRVRIADDLGPAMSHFPRGGPATVLYTYAHAFGGDDVKSYCLDVDGVGRTSWYEEWQLTPEIDIEPEMRKGTCGNCGREVRGLRGAPEIPVHVDTESRACETSRRPDTFAEYAHSKSIFPPNISIREGDQPK